MQIRPRRLRANPIIRNAVSETHLNLSSLVQPYFLSPNPKAKEEIKGFTHVYRWGIEQLSSVIENDLERGLKQFLLFGSAQVKDGVGSESKDENALLPTAIRNLKKRFGDSILLLSDVCLCPYTDHGHCGVLNGDKIENDRSVSYLAEMALCHAEQGVDFVAPSDMMDGRVLAIRKALDTNGFPDTGILSYTAKFASHYYGPFREALGSAPKGDRKTYQMDFRNQKESLREMELDVEEGADILMVKPALAYLDIISLLQKESSLPIAAYSVSGEYELVQLMAREGLAKERDLAMENLTAIKRAGATWILTYFATKIAKEGWL